MGSRAQCSSHLPHIHMLSTLAFLGCGSCWQTRKMLEEDALNARRCSAVQKDSDALVLGEKRGAVNPDSSSIPTLTSPPCAF